MSTQTVKSKKTLVFAPGKLGIEFAPVVDNGAVKLGCKVHAIDPLSKAKDKLAPGMILVAVNGNDVQQTSFVRILDLLALTKTQSRTLQFTAAVGGATPAPAQKAAKTNSTAALTAVVDALSSNASTDGSFRLHKLDDVASVVSQTGENPLVEAYSAKKETRAASATTPRSRALVPSSQNQQQQQSLHPHGSCTTPRKRSRPEMHGALDKENAAAAGARTEPRRPTKPIIRDREQHEAAASSDLSFGPAGTAVCPSCSSYCKHVEYLASEVESLRAALRNMSAKHSAMKQEIAHKRGYIKTVESKLATTQQQLEQTRTQLDAVSAEKERALVQQQAEHEAAVQELQQTIDELTRQNEEQQQKLQDLAEARNHNEELEQLREELLETQQKLKLRSGQCLLKEGQKQKAGVNFEAQLLEMQSMLEALRESEQAMKHKLRQKDGRLMLMQAQLSRLRQSAESAVLEPAATAAVVVFEQQEEQQDIAPEQLEQAPAVAAPGSEKTDEPDDDDDSLMEEETDAAPDVEAHEQSAHACDDKRPCDQQGVSEAQRLDAETQAQLSFREETAALQLDIVERLQNEKDGLHALIQSMKADKDTRERIVETMRQELQSIIGSHLEMKAELAESKDTIRKLNDENVKLQARLSVLEVENKLWHEMPSSSPNRAKRLSPVASPSRNSDGRRSPSPFPLREVTRISSTAAEEEDSVVLGELVNEESPCNNSNHADESGVSGPGCDDPTPVRVNSCMLRVDPMNQSTQSLLRMVASQSPVTNDSPSTPKSLPLSGAHISQLTPFAGVETPTELHSRVSAASNSARSSSSNNNQHNNSFYNNVSGIGTTNASMVTVPLSSPSKRSPLPEPSLSSNHRSIQPVRTPPRSRSRDSDDQDAVDFPAQSPSKTDNSSVHSLSRFLERTYDSEMMADATLLDSSISLMPLENSPVSVVSHMSPTSFNTAPQTPVSVASPAKNQPRQNATPETSQCEGVFPSPHNMIASRKYLSSQMLYQILKSTPMRAQTIQDPMHAAPSLLRERALLTQQSPTTQRVVGC